MTSHEIRKRFLDFFQSRGHTVLPSASIIPSDEQSETDATLFNTAGMQPLIPYLLGTPHPSGNRLVSAQQCVRTTDLAEVGDTTHATFFEMLGNWSLGDYFKREAIQWSYEFLTDPTYGLGLDPERIYCTVFAGDTYAPQDTEAYEIWQQYIPESRLFYMGADTNWWSAGENGPCGPDSEMFYDITGTCDIRSREDFLAADDRGDIVEVWNDVFMEYKQENGQVVGKLDQHNVDTGAGLERLAAILQDKPDIFATDVFAPIIAEIRQQSGEQEVRAERIVSDHMKAATFMIAAGVTPDTSGRGYILRRLIRRATRLSNTLAAEADMLVSLIPVVADIYHTQYPYVAEAVSHVQQVVRDEQAQFSRTLARGLREIEKTDISHVSGTFLFDMYQSFGFPPEMTIEEVQRRGGELPDSDTLFAEFETCMQRHQEQSRSAAKGKFKGGLADTNEQTIRYHTATHLLHQALREVLGNHVLQKGSHITTERLRFDFSHTEKLTDEKIARIEEIVNEKIAEDLPVVQEEMPLEEARKRGALGVFDDAYGETVSVYQIGTDADVFSLEICGGPHVSRTGELGTFRITKEQANAKGVRRIKAVLE